MSEYVSKDNFEQYDSKLKEYIDSTFENNLDLLSYGVQWNTGLSDQSLTRIGNMTYHKTLPILNNMKGCIAQMKDGAKIMYYLNENNWGRRKDPIILKNKQFNYNESKTKWLVIDDVFSTKLYTNCHIYVLGYEFNVDSIDTENKTAEISYHGVITDGNYYDIELGAVLTGYDGEVMVEVPEFWIKSWDEEDKKEVRITPTYIDSTWEHQPRCLVSAYKDTILREVPEDWGYLSTLPINSAISVNSIQKFCRGGNNDSSKDYLINSNQELSMLNKCISNVNKHNMRTWCRLSGKEILNYLQYKRIMYWLFVIEYATFNSQENFTDVLTPEGFRQGGLGIGLTNLSSNEWSNSVKSYSIAIKGRCNRFGNKTCIVKRSATFYTNSDYTESVTKDIYYNSYHGIEIPFGDIYTVLEGIFIINNNSDFYNVYVTDNPELYNETDYSLFNYIGKEIKKEGYIKEFNLMNTAEIIPISVGGTATTYKCDYKINNDSNLNIRMLCIGGGNVSNTISGLSCWRDDDSLNSVWNQYAYRSICIIK